MYDMNIYNTYTDIVSSPAGQSLSKLRSEFLDIRQRFNGRYVRLYGSCDRTGF
jgi:hypothetical protein